MEENNIDDHASTTTGFVPLSVASCMENIGISYAKTRAILSEMGLPGKVSEFTGDTFGDNIIKQDIIVIHRGHDRLGLSDKVVESGILYLSKELVSRIRSVALATPRRGRGRPPKDYHKDKQDKEDTLVIVYPINMDQLSLQLNVDGPTLTKALHHAGLVFVPGMATGQPKWTHVCAHIKAEAGGLVSVVDGRLCLSNEKGFLKLLQSLSAMADADHSGELYKRIKPFLDEHIL